MHWFELIAACLRAGRPVRFRATGSSMHPTIRSGEALWVVPVDPDRVRVGDVVLHAAFESRLVAHRVVDISSPPPLGGPSPPAVFLTKGDGCPRPDAPVMGAELLGKVAAVERSGRRVDPGRRSAWLYARAYHRLRGWIRTISRKR